MRDTDGKSLGPLDPDLERHPPAQHQPHQRQGDVPDVVLGPATRLLWRTHDTVHLELGSHAVVVEGLPQPLISRVASSAPTPSASVVAPESSALGSSALDALESLTAAGYLWPRPVDSDDPRFVPPAPRLTGELTALAARHGERAAELLNARRHSSVVIFGSGRAAAHLGAVLAAAGIGRVRCVSAGPVRLFHAVPGGIVPSDEGHDLSTATHIALARAAPEVDMTPLPVDERPDLTILAVDEPVDENRRVALHAAGAAHLVVALGTDHGVVGPLVLPGLTSCLHCADLHRRDRDPAWSALATQLAVPRRYGPTSDVAVATIVVGAAAMQVLAYLDGDDPAAIDGTIEVRPPDWRLRRRSRPPHPECDCTPDDVG